MASKSKTDDAFRQYDRTPPAEMRDLLKETASERWEVAAGAMRELAVALTTPLKRAILVGDISGNIFEREVIEAGTSPEYAIDFLTPGAEKDHIAYTNSGYGRIPEREVSGDYVRVPTYEVASSIDWPMKYARQARWPVLGRAMQVFEASFIRKHNNDCFYTLITAAAARNVAVWDDQATAGFFTKRLISLAKLTMRRNAGGNTASAGRGRLTDVYLSPEALEDMRSWDLTQVDDATRREIYLSSGEGTEVETVFGVRLHPVDEFGVGQEYQTFFNDTLQATTPGSKNEIAIGLDLTNRDSFVMPVTLPLQVYDDPMLWRQRRQGVYGYEEYGMAVLDARRIVILAI